MAGMADSIKSGLSKKVTEINLKTNSFLEINKIKTYIGTLEEEITELKRQLGNLTYRSWVEKVPVAEEAEKICLEIQQRQETVKRQENTIASLNEQTNSVLGIKETQGGTVICPQCGTVYQAGVHFCTKCGTKLA